VNGRLLLFYPRRWRQRYGQELLALVEACSDGRGASGRIRLDVIRAGLLQRLRSSGLVGDEVPPEARAKAGLLLVLGSWSLFVVAGIGLQKTSEHWQAVTPHGARAVPAAAFGGVVVAAAIGSVLVLLGIALAVGPLAGFLRAGGWRHLWRSVLGAICLSGLTAVVLAGVVAWAHHLTDAQRNGGSLLYGSAFLLLAVCGIGSIAAWTYAACAAARRLTLDPRTLRLEALIAAAVSVAMAAMTGAAAIWWASVERAAPAFLGSGLPLRMTALTLTMLAATVFAGAGTLRALHESA
jgi:hypothetical protein